MLIHSDNLEPLLFDETYHIYNKTVGSELLFKTELDYVHFLVRVKRYLLPVSDIYAYCLLPNHFHLLLKIKRIEEMGISPIKITESIASRAFSNFFISYAKSFNRAHQRQGRLFLQSYKRILVDIDDYFLTLVNYIHRNPIHHGLSVDYWEWKYSSYNAYLSGKRTKISKDQVMKHFSSLDEFIVFHEENKSFDEAEDYILE